MVKITRTTQVSGSIVVNVDRETAYDAVSDVTQMGRWSPENTGARVPNRGEPPFVGMRFVGFNRRGLMRWSTECTVTAADRGRWFAFEVRRIGALTPTLPVSIATWEYRFEPADGGGTLVTETWYDDRGTWPDTPALWFDRIVTGKRGFAAFQEGNITRTLERLKAELERER